MYRCINCQREVELDLKKARRVICTFCGHRILKKMRPKQARTVIVK